MKAGIKYIIYFIFSATLVVSFVYPKPMTLEKVEDLRLDMIEKKKKKALVKLISIYKDRNQPYDIRVEALRALAESRHPLVIAAIQEAVSDASMIELDIMLHSVDVLAQFGEEKSSPAFINGLRTTESKVMAIRESIISGLSKNGSDDEIMTLLDLYEISKTNSIRMDRMLSLKLGQMEDDRAIPVLMEIASDDQVDIETRTIAVEVLAKKQAPELVDYFIQLLGEPSNRHRLNEFTLSVMGDIDNDRMILALLESYKNGKSQYHSLLNSVLATVEEYQNPEIIPLLKEVAISEALPNGTRLKAIEALAKFKDERSMDAIIEMLEDPKNYVFYYDILMVIDDFGGYNEFKNRIRTVGHRAMLNQRISND